MPVDHDRDERLSAHRMVSVELMISPPSNVQVQHFRGQPKSKGLSVQLGACSGIRLLFAEKWGNVPKTKGKRAPVEPEVLNAASQHVVRSIAILRQCAFLSAGSTQISAMTSPASTALREHI